MATVIEQYSKLKKSIIISIALHIILFSVLIWNLSDKNMTKVNSNELPINAMLITPRNTIMKNYRHEKEQKNTRFLKEQYKKQIDEQKINEQSQLKFDKKHSKICSKNQIEKEKIKKKPKNMKKTSLVMKTTLKKTEKTTLGNKKSTQKSKKDIKHFHNNFSLSENLLKNDKVKSNNISLKVKRGEKKYTALSKDINEYAEKIKLAIENRFYDASSYAGKTCTLRIKLAPNGILRDIQSEKGDSFLCTAALAAARQARIPKPSSNAVYETFKNAILDFKP